MTIWDLTYMEGHCTRDGHKSEWKERKAKRKKN